MADVLRRWAGGRLWQGAAPAQGLPDLRPRHLHGHALQPRLLVRPSSPWAECVCCLRYQYILFAWPALLAVRAWCQRQRVPAVSNTSMTHAPDCSNMCLSSACIAGCFVHWLSGEPRARSGQCHLTYMYDKAEA